MAKTQDPFGVNDRFVKGLRGCSDADGLQAYRPKIAVITVNYFSSTEVASMVMSLAGIESNCDLLMCVVDNSCDDDEWNRLNEHLLPVTPSFATLRIHRSETNCGYAAGNNAGFRALAAINPDVVIVINPDVVVLEADLDALVRDLHANPTSIFGAKTLSGGKILSGLGSVSMLTGRSRELLPGEARGRMTLVYPSGHFMAVRGDVWRSIQGLSEDYFLFGEEADIVLRLRTAYPDLEVRTIENIEVSHTGGLTSGASDVIQKKSLTTFHHATRSSVVLFRKHRALRPWLPLILTARLGFAVKAVFKVGPRAAKAILDGLRSGLTWERERGS